MERGDLVVEGAQRPLQHLPVGRRVGDRVALQGNMDPAVLFSSPEAIEREATAMVLAPPGDGARANGSTAGC